MRCGANLRVTPLLEWERQERCSRGHVGLLPRLGAARRFPCRGEHEGTIAAPAINPRQRGAHAEDHDAGHGDGEGGDRGEAGAGVAAHRTGERRERRAQERDGSDDGHGLCGDRLEPGNEYAAEGTDQQIGEATRETRDVPLGAVGVALRADGDCGGNRAQIDAVRAEGGPVSPRRWLMVLTKSRSLGW